MTVTPKPLEKPQRNLTEVLLVGKVVKAVGLKGEMKVFPYCDYPEMFNDFKRLYIAEKEDYATANLKKAQTSENLYYTPLSVRIQKEMVFIKLKNVNTIEDTEKIVGKFLFVTRDEIKLEKNSYFIRDLIGITVSDIDTGLVYGKITDVLQTGANDVYVVNDTNNGNLERLVPAIADVVISTDITGGIIKIRPLEGLFDI
jgi:16S rRNA processing protein RimM